MYVSFSWHGERHIWWFRKSILRDTWIGVRMEFPPSLAVQEPESWGNTYTCCLDPWFISKTSFLLVHLAPREDFSTHCAWVAAGIFFFWPARSATWYIPLQRFDFFRRWKKLGNNCVVSIYEFLKPSQTSLWEKVSSLNFTRKVKTSFNQGILIIFL